MHFYLKQNIVLLIWAAPGLIWIFVLCNRTISWEAEIGSTNRPRTESALRKAKFYSSHITQRISAKEHIQTRFNRKNWTSAQWVKTSNMVAWLKGCCQDPDYRYQRSLIDHWCTAAVLKFWMWLCVSQTILIHRRQWYRLGSPSRLIGLALLADDGGAQLRSWEVPKPSAHLLWRPVQSRNVKCLT